MPRIEKESMVVCNSSWVISGLRLQKWVGRYYQKYFFLCVPFLDINIQFGHPVRRLGFTQLSCFSIAEVFGLAWIYFR